MCIPYLFLRVKKMVLKTKEVDFCLNMEFFVVGIYDIAWLKLICAGCIFHIQYISTENTYFLMHLHLISPYDFLLFYIVIVEAVS